MKNKLEEIRLNSHANKIMLFKEIRYHLTMEKNFIIEDDAEMLPEIISIGDYLINLLCSQIAEDIQFAIIATETLIEFVGEIVLKKKEVHTCVIRSLAYSDEMVIKSSARLLIFIVAYGFATSEALEEELKMRIKNLSDASDGNRNLSVLIVREFAFGAPVQFYQYMQPFFEHIFPCFKDPRIETRIAARDTLRALLTILAQRELSQKPTFNWYEFIYDKALRLLSSEELKNVTEGNMIPTRRTLSYQEGENDLCAHAVLLIINEFLRQCSLDLELYCANLIQIFPIRTKTMHSNKIIKYSFDQDHDPDHLEIDNIFYRNERIFAKRSKNYHLYRYTGIIPPEIEKYCIFQRYIYDDENGESLSNSNLSNSTFHSKFDLQKNIHSNNQIDYLNNVPYNYINNSPYYLLNDTDIDINSKSLNEIKSISIVGCYSYTLNLLMKSKFEEILKFCNDSLINGNVYVLITVCQIIPNLIFHDLSLFKHLSTQNIILHLINIFSTSPARPYILLCFTLLGKLLKSEFLIHAKNILGYIKSLYPGNLKDVGKKKQIEMEAPIACFICSMIQYIGRPFIEAITMDFVNSCINNMIFDFSVAAIFSEITTCPSKLKLLYQDLILEYLSTLLGYNNDETIDLERINERKSSKNLSTLQTSQSLKSLNNQTTLNINKKISNDIEAFEKLIITALIGLRMCDFNIQNINQIIIFISDTYLNYPLSEIREESSKTCLKLLESIINSDLTLKFDREEYKTQIISSSVFKQKNTFKTCMPSYCILNIINKITGIGIADIDVKTRLNILSSFTSAFYPYLILLQNVQCLIIGLHDSKFEIKCVTASLLGRLCSLQPAYIFPILMKYLTEILSQIETKRSNKTLNNSSNLLLVDKFSECREKSAILLNYLIVSSNRIALECVQSIFDIILPIFNDDNASVSLICNIMSIISDLISVCDKNIYKFLPNILCIITNILIDSVYSYYKRKSALDVLCHILNTFGYIFHEFFSVNKLNDILINYIKAEKSKENRCLASNALGLIGAINPSKLKIFYSSHEFIQQINNEYTNIFDTSIENNIINTDNDINTCDFYIKNKINSLEELYPLVAIESLLMILNDNNMIHLHSVVLHELERILIFLGKNSVKYTSKIFTIYFKVISITNNDTRLVILQQINKLTSLVGTQLRNYLSNMFEMLDKIWLLDSPLTLQITILQLIDNLITSLPFESKFYFKIILPKITMILNYNIDIFTNDEFNILKTKTISTLQHIVPYMNNYLHVIIPIIITTYSYPKNLLPLRRLAMETMHVIANTSNIIEYASPIMQSLINILDKCIELQSITLLVLSTMVLQLGNIYYSYIPTISRIMNKHKIKSSKYDSSLKMIGINEYLNHSLTYKQDVIKLDNTTLRRRFSSGVETLVNRNKPPLDKLRLKWAWITSNKTSKEDFHNWFKKLCNEFLLNSPSFPLKACQPVCFEYPPITKNLFNCSFVCIWKELNDELKTNLFHSILDVLTRECVPEIILILLNLIEFTNYVELDFNLNYDIVSKSAAYVNAYTIALFFKEKQFQDNQFDLNVLQSIISLNMKLQNIDASYGVLKYIKLNSTQQINIPEEWYELLNDYDGALNGYNNKLKENPNNQFFLHKKMKCLQSLGKWNELRDLLNQTDIQKNENNIDNIFLAQIGVSCCLGLNDFKTLENKYLPIIPQDSFLGYYYNSIILIHHEKYNNAKLLINNARYVLDNELTNALGDNYDQSYKTLVSAQLLTELDEIINYALMPNKRERIKMNWNSRIERCKPLVEDWEVILNLRSIVVPPLENIESWLKFANLARKTSKINLAERTFSEILNINESFFPNIFLNDNAFNSYEIHPNIIYAFIKFLWFTKNQNDAYLYMKMFSNKITNKISLNQNDSCMNNCSKMYYNNSLSFDSVHSSSNINKSIEVQSNFNNLKHLLAKCYLNMGRWKQKLDSDQLLNSSISTISNYFNMALYYDKSWIKSIHSHAIFNYEVVLHYKREIISIKSKLSKSNKTNFSKINKQDNENYLSEMHVAESYAVPAINGFFESLRIYPDFALQDILRIITLWFDFGQFTCVHDVVKKSVGYIKIDYWLQVIPQLIARINIPKINVASLIQDLLIDIGKNHPQSLIYPIAVAANNAVESMTNNQVSNIQKVISSLEEHSSTLVSQALLVSHEFIRLSVCWHELTLRILEEIFFAFNYDKSIPKILTAIDKLDRALISKEPETIKESLFKQCYQKSLIDLARLAKRYRNTSDEKCITEIWSTAHDMFNNLNKELNTLFRLELSTSSPKLLSCYDLELAVPSTYEPNKPIIRISSIFPNIFVMKSKQRPRKLIIIGNNGNEFVFLLKGNEDLRQDERVMQLFKLINSLLSKDTEALKRELFVTRYSVIPLSVNSGLIGWVQNCDTLNSLIVERRKFRSMNPDSERNALNNICPYYSNIPFIKKIHTFERALLINDGEDIADIIYRKSPSCDVWFNKRNIYTRSLASMSIVGYILGLGDRHLSNMMMDRKTGRIIHIDFGDCFEVCMTRTSYPEKVPFRLTRVLVKALEVTGINGSYQITCEHVMRVLRHNKDSVFAVLEAFIYDPLISWRLLDGFFYYFYLMFSS